MPFPSDDDDANRALMGANMQRQAVPVLVPERPSSAPASSASRPGLGHRRRGQGRGGIVDQVDTNRIVIRVNDQGGTVAGKSASTSTTCIKLPAQQPGTRASTSARSSSAATSLPPRAIIADGASTDLGELAPRPERAVAFMPWNGYNFEDSILISERVVADDRFTSIHIEELVVMARDTKLGSEEITRDIPNVARQQLRAPDESGIVYVGAEVNRATRWSARSRQRARRR